MSLYTNYPLNSDDIARETGSSCIGYGTGQSHERIIQGAGGEIGYDGFKDPRPGHDGSIYADRVFINEKTNEIQGVNFNDRNGKFCCSYMGESYSDIKDSNKRDIEYKQAKNKESDQNRQEEYDAYGAKKSNAAQQGLNQNNQNGIKR